LFYSLSLPTLVDQTNRAAMRAFIQNRPNHPAIVGGLSVTHVTRRQQAVDAIQSKRLSAIIRTMDREIASNAMHAAVEGGFRLIEFTLTTPGALDLIGSFAERDDLVETFRFYRENKPLGKRVQIRTRRRQLQWLCTCGTYNLAKVMGE